MAYDRTPFFIDGGVLHPGDVVRNQTWKATQGASGVGSPRGLLVRAKPVPGPSVLIEAGTYVVESNYPAAPPEQSYDGRNRSNTEVAVPATTSAGVRYDMLVWRVDDPEYNGRDPELVDWDADEFHRPELITNVPASAIASNNAATNWLLANRAYPCVPLAGITMPASTATVIQSYLVDLRDMANPRRLRVPMSYSMLGKDTETLTATIAAGEYFPNAAAAAFFVDIPRWATRVTVRGDWGQVRHRKGAAHGEMWVRIGPPNGGDAFFTQRSRWDTPAVADEFRQTWTVLDDIPVPAAARGQRRQIIMYGRLLSSSAADARPQMDENCSIGVDLEFREAPVYDSI